MVMMVCLFMFRVMANGKWQTDLWFQQDHDKQKAQRQANDALASVLFNRYQ